MKTNWMLLLVWSAVGMWTFNSCSDDEDVSVAENASLVSTTVQSALATRYPTATNIEWGLSGTYAVAEFDWNNYEHTAWFDSSSAEWYMTETDIRYSDLPSAVKTAFESSEYANWEMDDVDMLTREGMETLYVLEVEQGNTEVELVYTSSGVLVNTMTETEGTGSSGNNESYLPSTSSSSTQTISSVVAEKYPNATIIEIDYEQGYIEVEILDGNVCRDVYYSTSYEWLKTTWDVRTSELPTAVTQAVATDYSEYTIDDAEYVNTPSGDWYELELEHKRADYEIDVKITADGTWISV